MDTQDARPVRPTIIAGSRHRGTSWLPLLRRVMVQSEQLLGATVGAVISGKEPTGIDRLGELWAEETGRQVIPFPADWYDFTIPWLSIRYPKDGRRPYNAAAGHWRNERMAVYAEQHGGQAVLLWDGRSPGTRDMMERCEAHGIPFVCWLLPSAPEQQPTVHRTLNPAAPQRLLGL